MTNNAGTSLRSEDSAANGIHAEEIVATALPDYSVEMIGVTKQFGKLVANRNVDLRVQRGEIRALLGENGAGKSTLMNMLYGILKPTSGSIRINGEEVRFNSPQDARAAGIAMVHQHYMLVPTLTAMQNMILGDKDAFVLSQEHLTKVRARLNEIGRRYGLDVNLDAPVWRLSVGEQQRVEILRALYHDAKILILDEPTAMLTPREVGQLLPRLQKLASEGTTIIIISHHLDEVMEFADRISVLRGGENVSTIERSQTSAKELAALMVGRDVNLDGAAFAALSVQDTSNNGQERAPRSKVIEVRDLSAEGDHGVRAIDNVTFDVCSGEIVAIAGVSGNGQAELEEVLFGLRAASSGSVSMQGTDITVLSSGERAKRGVSYIPSDRYRYGLVGNLEVSSNMILDRFAHPDFGSRWKLSKQAILSFASSLVDRFGIRLRAISQQAGTLSGGNAQRVVLARTLTRDNKCLIAAQPARGLDVGAVSFVWEKLSEARSQGVAVLLISTELEEIFALADRCFVIYRGRLVGEWSRKELNRDTLGLAMGGLTDKGANTESGLVEEQPNAI